MGDAFLWGAVAGSSLVLGRAIALRLPITRRQLGLIRAFGAGGRIRAVAYEPAPEALQTSAGDGRLALGLFAGSLVFFAGECSATASRAPRTKTARRARTPCRPVGRSCSGSSSTGSRNRSSWDSPC